MNKEANSTEVEEVVLAFFALWDSENIDKIVDCFTPDATYTDMPLPPRHGQSAIREYVTGVFNAFSVRIETLHIASRDTTVLTERVDHLVLKGGTPRACALPIMGVMEVRDGKISQWRDYFDLATAEQGFGLNLRPEPNLSDSQPHP